MSRRWVANTVRPGSSNETSAIKTWSYLADLALVGEGGLVAVVAVGDQELAGRELGRDRLVNRRIADSPDAVGRAVAVGHLTPGIAERRLEVLPALPGWRAKIGERLWRGRG